MAAAHTRRSGSQPETVFLNGKLVPGGRAAVSIQDRGFLYGDGLFETIRVHEGKPFRWKQHLQRLQQGMEVLRLTVPFSAPTLLAFAGELIAANEKADCLLRLTVSRGPGPRGFSARGAVHPTVLMALHSAPELGTAPPEWRVRTSSVRLFSADRLCRLKTANKLPQILARLEADEAGVEEALLLNEAGFAVEASANNLFWIQENVVMTPPTSAGALPGITRASVMDICRRLGIALDERAAAPETLRTAGGVFLSGTAWEIAEVVELDGHMVGRSALTSRIATAVRQLKQEETESLHAPSTLA